MANRSRLEQAHQLHQRLLQGDPLAPAELVETFMEELVRRLRARAQPLRDDDLILDASTDTLLAYAQQPTKFDPAKSSLLTYLTMSAYGDLRNMLARDYRKKKREIPLEDVEHSLSLGNNMVEEAEDEVLERYGISTIEKALLLRRVVEEFPDSVDRQLLNLMLSGERKTAAYSAVLGIRDSDQGEQKRIVKRHKDRLTKRLQRLGGRFREQKQDH